MRCGVSRKYRYVGPEDIRAKALSRPGGGVIGCAADVAQWARAAGQPADRGGTVVATFVIDIGGRLLVADRRSEHVACAGGGDVLSAGEMFFVIDGNTVRVEEVSNQSTGYCPEPESWPAVERTLEHAGIKHPGGFTTVCVFRRCEACGARNIVKDDWFYCDVCGAALSAQWNFD